MKEGRGQLHQAPAVSNSREEFRPDLASQHSKDRRSLNEVARYYTLFYFSPHSEDRSVGWEEGRGEEINTVNKIEKITIIWPSCMIRLA